jgi:Secretion system C-terminal sorting domain
VPSIYKNQPLNGFELVNGPDCASMFLYDYNESLVPLNNAININFVLDPLDPGVRGYTNYGSNRIYIENALDEFLTGNNNWWSMSGLISHEFGHTRYLKHTFNCSNPCGGIDLDVEAECCGQCWPTDSYSEGCWQCSEDNLMMSYDAGQIHLTECETREIWSYIVNTPRAYQEIDYCAETLGADEIVFDYNNYVVWDQNKFFNKNIIIKSGTTVEVQCEVLMGASKQIIIESGGRLLVNGGTISNLCSELWSGIKVYGGNADYDVKFVNNSVIENTNAPAVSMFSPLPWPEIQQYGNGILQADNTTFNNTQRIVEFIAWSPKINSSYIRNCVQNGGKWCITNWNCQEIEISNNTFNNILKDCVVSEVGSYVIYNNEFNSQRNDILYNNVSAGISSIIESNTFNGTNTGYRTLGTTFAQNEIVNNIFQTNQYDIFSDGHNNYKIWNNDFSSTFGIISFDNGAGIGDVYNNEFYGNLIGLMPLGYNANYNFFNNCFSTSYVDVYVEGQVSVVIHNGGESADNCFSHNGNASSVVRDIGGNPGATTYLEPLDQTVDCRDAVLAHPNITRFQYGSGSFPTCGSEIGGGLANWNYCVPRIEVEEASTAYTWLLNKLEEIENDPNLTTSQKEMLLAIYKRCFLRVSGILFELDIREENFQNARDQYRSKGHGDEAVYIFSSYIMENKLDSARQYLNLINDTTEQLTDFITIQSINLDRIPYGPYFNCSDSILNVVENIANKSHPYSAYGKALYYALTGEIISSEVPSFSQRSAQITSSNPVVTTSSISIFPNPFLDILHIRLSELNNTKIEIFDMYGKLIYVSTPDRSLQKINTIDWGTGLYVVVVRRDEEILKHDLIVLIK